MRFIFSFRFYILLALGLVPLSLSWNLPSLRNVVIAFDVLLIAAALFDYLFSRTLPEGFSIRREFDKRFAIGDPTTVSLIVVNETTRDIRLRLKDGYPGGLKLEDTRQAEFIVGARTNAEFSYRITPPKRGRYEFGKTSIRFLSDLGWSGARQRLASPKRKGLSEHASCSEIELKALGIQSLIAVRRRAIRRGEGREFESMRDYVRGDELRHISWTATPAGQS